MAVPRTPSGKAGTAESAESFWRVQERPSTDSLRGVDSKHGRKKFGTMNEKKAVQKIMSDARVLAWVLLDPLASIFVK
jgi:hypothetical protein